MNTLRVCIYLLPCAQTVGKVLPCFVKLLALVGQCTLLKANRGYIDMNFVISKKFYVQLKSLRQIIFCGIDVSISYCDLEMHVSAER